MKAGEDSAEIPVIFLSAKSDQVDKLEGFEAGGVDYIAKPIDVAEVLARVRSHLAIRALQADLATANATLEHRVAARTAELEEEVDRRKQSDSERETLLEVVRHQSEELRVMTNQLLAHQQQRNALMAREMDENVVRSLSLANFHLESISAEVDTVGVSIGTIAPHLNTAQKLIRQVEKFATSAASSLVTPTPVEKSIEDNPLVALTGREREVLHLIVEGHPTRKIAELVHVAETTVRTYRYRIMKKLGVNDVPSLVRLVITHES